MVKHKRPRAFYETFERKSGNQKVTHYCPGCGHGTIHKYIAEAIDDFHIQDKVIFCSPVGCSVFAYYYFDVGNIQCAHGRAASVATAIKRTRKDSIVISYQGDGDLAGIGMGGIIHAANRGENITVIFINNAIYGMTGGQMAPTTLLDQKTTTTPFGRDPVRDGGPVRMCELIDAIEAPVYVERVSLGTPAKSMKARKAVRKALKNQVEGKGFSFVEVLSPCPVNWKMTSIESRQWLVENLEPVFPVKQFRDIDNPFREDHSFPFLINEDLKKFFGLSDTIDRKRDSWIHEDQNIKIAGFGGQGVISAGILLANCFIKEGAEVSWLPSYGPEMRGGTAHANVIASKETIGSPVVDSPTILFALNGPSFDAFEDSVTTGGLVFVNSTMAEREARRKDTKTIFIPATKMATELGLINTANVIMIGAYLAYTGAIQRSTLEEIIPQSLKKKEYIDTNLKALSVGIEFIENKR